jgi:hypothetical protein
MRHIAVGGQYASDDRVLATILIAEDYLRPPVL